MAIFLQSNVFNGTIPRIIELQDNYLINGQVYTKDYVPQPLSFCPLNNTGSKIMLNETIIPGCLNGTSNTMKNACIVDKEDSSKQYILTDGYDTTSPSLWRFQVKDNKIINTLNNNWTSANSDTQEYLTQDNQYIYVLNFRSYNGSSAYLVKYNKQSTQVNYVDFGSWPSIRFIGETNNDLYFAISNNNNNFTIERINKNSMTKTTILDDTIVKDKGSNSIVSFSLYPTEINSDGNFYAIRSIKHCNKEEKIDKIIIKKYNFDPVTENIKHSIMNIDYNNIEEIIKHDNNQSYKWELFEHKYNNKKYLTMFTINAQNNSAVVSIRDNFICTFEILNDDKLKCISKKSLGTIQYRGMIKMINNSSFIVASNSTVEFYNWSEINKCFEKTNQYIGNIKVVGLDKSFNVYVQNNDSSVELLAKTLPIKIEADFEKDQYNYKLKDIGSYIYIKAYNYFNKFLTYNFEVNLSGPVKFTDTGLKKKIITTLDSGELKIPVTIYGKGIMEINLKEIN